MFTGTPGGLAWGALFTALLATGCVTDVRSRRIPNRLVAALLAAGAAYSVAMHPFVPGLLTAGLGVLVGFGIWIGFHLLGVLGAGDVKFFAAAGAWLGPSATWRAALLAAAVGGGLAVIELVRQRRLKRTVWMIAHAGVLRSTAGLAELPAGAPRARQLPYGVALATGALLAAWVPNLLR